MVEVKWSYEDFNILFSALYYYFFVCPSLQRLAVAVHNFRAYVASCGIHHCSLSKPFSQCAATEEVRAGGREIFLGRAGLAKRNQDAGTAQLVVPSLCSTESFRNASLSLPPCLL